MKRAERLQRKWTRSRGGRKIIWGFASILLATTARAAPDIGAAYWSNVLAEVDSFYQITNDHANGIKQQYSNKVQALRSDVAKMLKNDPAVLRQARDSLRDDERVWVRAFSASMLIKAFKGADTEDLLLMLSDPDLDVRGFAISSIGVFRSRDAVPCLPVGLLSKIPAERSCTLSGIRNVLGWRGFPYYTEFLNDTDDAVAATAADALRVCKPLNAIPHLRRYLDKYGTDLKKKVPTDAVIRTLYALHGEPIPKELVLGKEVDAWRNRLRSQNRDHQR